MSELRDAERMIEAAEQAAGANDFASADDLLKSAASIQEAELGPLHPDLANTLNNLAIVAEKTGRLDDAETFYRRAVAIASASLPVDHPMIAASRENLEDFCRAHGVPIALPAFLAPLPRDTAVGLDVFAREPATASGETLTPDDVAAADTGFTMEATPPPSDAPWPVRRQPPPTAAEPPRQVSRSLVWAATGVVVLLAAIFLVRQPWSEQATTPPPTPETTPPPRAAEPAPPPSPEPPAKPAPSEPAQPPSVVPRRGAPNAAANQARASSPVPGGAISLATAQLCRTLATRGGNWRCDQTADPVSPGQILLYTRVRSPRDGVVVHRWYRRNALRQSVKLTIRASPTEGYRTYSRQTVDGGVDWRVEVTSVTGDVLYERRFDVR